MRVINALPLPDSVNDTESDQGCETAKNAQVTQDRHVTSGETLQTGRPGHGPASRLTRVRA